MDNTESKNVEIKSGAFVKERYMKCPKKCNCQWKLGNTHKKGYEYLNNTCYLSGSFRLKCPE